MLRAQNTVEYALLIAAVAVLALLGGAVFGTSLSRWLAALLERITAL